jgi:hypothetical protein
MADFHDISEYIRASKDALDLVKAAVGFLPKGREKEEAESKIKDAEEALRRSDVQLAKKLGMHLCQCTFPPQIMLWKEQERWFACPNSACGSTKRFARPESTSGRRSWTDARKGR